MPDRHVRGPSRARKHARLETKPTPTRRDYRDSDGTLHATVDSGGGYERIRTTEHDPRNASDGTTSVQFSHHRLLAIAWNVDRATGVPILPPGTEGVVDPAVLVGDDVHHNAPEVDGERAIPWDNREACLTVEDHGEHAGITNAERRAYARDGQKLRDGTETLPSAGCDACDADETKATFAGTDAEYCLECATAKADGRTVEIL